MSNAPPWILLRGLMRDGRHWGEFPAMFRGHLSAAAVHTVDLPGNGSRYREQSPSSVDGMVAWLRAELVRQALPPPYRVLAMSLGAMVAAAWAQRYPQELEACVLINTSLRPFSPFYRRLKPAAWPLLLRMALGKPSAREAEQAILELTSRHHRQDAALLDDWSAWRQSTPVSRENALRQLGAAMGFRAPARSPHYRLLLLSGAGDQLVDTRCSLALASAWQCPVRVHPTAGHDLPLDAGPWVAQQVREWLDAQPTAKPQTNTAR